MAEYKYPPLLRGKETIINMPEINIKVQLEDLKYCNGCSCLHYDKCEINFCGHGYTLDKEAFWKKDKELQPRPEICIQENKEVVK